MLTQTNAVLVKILVVIFQTIQIFDVRLQIIKIATASMALTITQAHKTLLGIMLICFGAGFVNDWGVISIYFLSYYYFHGAPVQIKASTNSLMMIIMVIPVTFCLIFSIKIAHMVGYQRLIKYCAAVFLIAPLVTCFNFDFTFFMVFNMVIACSALALALPPLFHCMYSHYANNKSLATGAAICSFGFGAIFWNALMTMLINPDNTVPDIETIDPNFNFFTNEISLRVPRATNVMYFGSGILFFLGALLISNNPEYHDDQDIEIDLNASHHLYESSSLHDRPRELSKQENKEIAVEETPQPVQHQTSFEFIKHYALQPVTLLLFAMNISGCMYQVYVQLNTKLIYMSFLQDDHLISLGLMINIVSSAVCSIAWGALADMKGAPVTIIAFIIVDILIKIYSSIHRTRAGFIISMILLGGTDKTMLVLFGPILINFFGLKVASQLLPLKGLSGILSVILASILGYIFANMSPQKGLYFTCIFSVINFALGICLAYIVRQHEKKKQLKEKQNNFEAIQNTF